ncbi:hypothetical protein Tco_0364729 [Tanacetum coccineum]
MDCYNYHKEGTFAQESSSKKSDYKNKESTRRTMPVETSTSTTLVSCDGLGANSLQAEDGRTRHSSTHNHCNGIDPYQSGRESTIFGDENATINICHTYHNLYDVTVNGDLEEEIALTGETSGPPAPN